MKVIDEKNNEIEVLNNLELENAELKAKSLRRQQPLSWRRLLLSAAEHG